MKRNESWQLIPVRMYTPQYATLPYDLELKLPDQVIDNIYSFLRPRYIQKDARKMKIDRMQMYLNHKYTLYMQLKYEKLRRVQVRKSDQERRQKLIDALTAIETALKKLL